MSTLAVVIPTYNEAEYLPRLLAALQQQTRKPDEIVVADAHSTDATRNVAAEFGARIVDGGNAAEGRNAGAAATTSELVLFLDADAILPDDHALERAVTEMTERRIDLATVDIAVLDGNLVDRSSFHFYNAYVRLWGNVHPHAIGTFMLTRRTVHETIGGFDPTVTFAEDHDYGVRARDAGFRFASLNSIRIGITARRQRRIGRIRFMLVNALAEPYIFLFGPIRIKSFADRYDGK